MNRALLGVAVIVGALAASSSVAETIRVKAPFLERPVAVGVEGTLELLTVGRVHSSSPRQDPRGTIRLRVTTDFSPSVRFVTDLTGTAGGTQLDPSGPGVYDYHGVVQDISPNLEVGEAYLDLDSTLLDLRVGVQKFAWGKLDGVQPNDLLNPQKYYDPLLEDENDRKIGIPAIAPTFYLPSGEEGKWPTDLRLTLAWAPIYVPYYFPELNERWYPPVARVPAESEVDGITVQNQADFRNAPLPPRTLENSTVAARLSGLFGSADFAAYYFDGFDPAPALDASARGFLSLDPLDPPRLEARSQVDIFPEFDRIRAAGGDIAYRVLEATLRLEAAYIFDRPYMRNLNDLVASEQIGPIRPAALLSGNEEEVPVVLGPVNVQRDGVEWGAGGDTFLGDTYVLLQVNQTVLPGNHVNLLISNYETRFSITLRHAFFGDRLKAELGGVYAMQGVAGLAHPHLTYSLSDHFDVRVGYLAIEGHENSVIGEYRQNDEGYVRARFLF